MVIQVRFLSVEKGMHHKQNTVTFERVEVFWRGFQQNDPLYIF